jgi:AraC family transcriptional regulator, transcriptional activator for feuABC-ybbA operon
MNYDFLCEFHPNILDVVIRDKEYWEEFNYQIKRNSTKLHTLGLVWRGKGKLQIDDQQFYLNKGIFFQIKPNVTLNLQSNLDEDLAFYSIHYTGQLINNGGKKIKEMSTTLPFPTCVQYNDYQPLMILFKQVYSSWNNKKLGYDWESKLNFLGIINEMIRLEELKKEEINYNDDIERVLEYINSKFQDPLSREDLASYIGLSPSYFSTIFKKHTGYTPINYLNKVRIDRAKQLLRSTSLPVSRVSLEVGIVDSFYFARIFTKSTGFSPSEYRKA